MGDIERYDYHGFPDETGVFVRYEDHVAAVDAARSTRELMTDHLPECNEREVIGLDCISDREQQEAEQRAYAAGVSAARDAVVAVSVRKDTSHDMRVQALAAIDALREEQK